MTIDANTIIGFLSGSLGTLIIKNIFDIFKSKTEFKRELKKKFFEKKLEAADKAVANLYTLSNSVGILSSSYEMMSDPKRNFSYQVFKAIVESSSKRIEKLSDISMSSINSIYLYTNLDNELSWTDNDDKRFLDNYSDLCAQDSNLLNAMAAYDYSLKNDTPEQQEKIRKDIQDLLLLLKAKMFDISQLLNQMKQALIDRRKIIREEFKKYKT